MHAQAHADRRFDLLLPGTAQPDPRGPADRFCELACHLPAGTWKGIGAVMFKARQILQRLHHMAANPYAFTQSIHIKHPIMSGSHMCCAMLCLPGETGQRMGRDLVREMPQIIACHVWAQRGKAPMGGTRQLVLAYKQGIHDGHRQVSVSTKHRTYTPL